MIYAIGDIHGQLAELDRVLSLIEADGGADAHIVFLGDYTDRGPDSRGVLDRLINGVSQGRRWTVLRGNHDRMFCRYLTDGNEHDERIKSGKGWLTPSLGGPTTLASYGVNVEEGDILKRAQAAVPPEHLAFLESRSLWYETDNLLFVHAGIKPGVPMDEQDEDDLIWIREGFLDYEEPFDKLIVHGHTALEQPTHFGNRIDIDSGAGYGRPLTAAVFEGTDCFILTETGRVPLLPTV